MAKDPTEEEFTLGDDEEEQQVVEKKKTSVIPNFRGKVPEPETAERTGPVQVTRRNAECLPVGSSIRKTVSYPEVEWASDESEEEEEEDDDDEEEEEGEPPKEGEEGQQAKRRQRKKKEEEDDDESDEEVLEEEEEWNFPIDKENWTEEDLNEEWADPTPADDTAGRDPELAEDDEELIAKLEKDGRAPPRRPYYVPYRKWYPPIPEGHPDIDSPETVVEELERMEEFLVWASYIFEDGSSYEGTVWDDLAHGKGVYTTPLELCRYEGEWFQNMMEGHGVLEVDLPVADPPPGSDLERRMKAEGKILKTDYLDPEDKEWLRMDLEDTLADNPDAIDPAPFEDDELWVKYFGEKPEKGRYKYAGQWKHNRMHGCGVYELNGRQIWGKFYFGEMLPDLQECDVEQSAMHSALAEVAAAKARMFVNKPDGMVREVKGPFTDPQHPYMYEEEDMWMAPGFINQYYPVPELWARYVKEIDAEQEMWLNSFLKSPLRIPMPPELEYLWGKDDEFVVLTAPPQEDGENANPEDEGEVLLHVPSGQLINWATDDEGQMRFFVQPIVEDGSVIPDLAIPLPLGIKEFLGEKGGDGGDDEGDDGDGEKKLTEDEKLEKDFEEENAERERRWVQEDTERELEWAERHRELELELELKDLDEKLEEAVDHAEMEAKFEELYGIDQDGEDLSDVVKEKGEREDLEEGQEEGSQDSPPQVGSPSQDADQDKEGEDEDEEDDGQDSKPQSFGKVAMATPEDRRGDSDNTRPPFPTVFASISLVSQTTLKQAMSFAVKEATRSWFPNLLASPSAPPATKKAISRPFESRPGVIYSPLTEVKCKAPNTQQISRLRARVAQRVQPKARTSPRSRASHCRASVQELWVAPSLQVLSLSVPLEI